MNFDIEEIKELSGDAASIYSVTKAIAKRINKAIVEKDIEIKDGKLTINNWEYED